MPSFVFRVNGRQTDDESSDRWFAISIGPDEHSARQSLLNNCGDQLRQMIGPCHPLPDELADFIGVGTDVPGWMRIK